MTLEQVYGAVTYYLRNQVELDSHLAQLSADFDSRARQQAALYPEIASKLRAAKEGRNDANPNATFPRGR